MNLHFQHTVIGGTFDHFHKGHKKLIDEALAHSITVTIGISTEKLYNNKFLASQIESYEVRQAAVLEYIQSKNIDTVITFMPIDDIYGSTLHDEFIDAIFVTEDNKNVVDLINKKRKEKHFHELTVKVVALVTGSDGKIISSERIRRGEIDRNGFNYAGLFHMSLELPSHLRATLREPIGKVKTDIYEIIKNLPKDSVFIAVGDIVTLSFAEAGHQATISVFDFKTRRHEINKEQKELLRKLSQSAAICHNAAGKIEIEAVITLNNALNDSFHSDITQTIKVNGEEDLLTLPAILLAPLGSQVIYGLFDQGAVVVEVTEQKKEIIRILIEQFTSLK